MSDETQRARQALKRHEPPPGTDREPCDCKTCEASRDVLALAAELEAAQKALLRCVEISGADTSGGIPTEPPLQEWAVRCVEELRHDYDSTAGEDSGHIAALKADVVAAEKRNAELVAAINRARHNLGLTVYEGTPVSVTSAKRIEKDPGAAVSGLAAPTKETTP